MPDPQLDLLTIGLCILSSVLAGFVNTLAGNGSAITLSAMTELLGIPPLLANGSNRVGVLSQSLSSMYSYWRDGRLVLRPYIGLLLLVLIAALLGGYTASIVSPDAFRLVFRIALLMTLALLIFNPQRWMSTESRARAWPRPLLGLAALAVGFYGGFIQMGFGPLFLALCIFGAGMPYPAANMLKILVVGLYTIPLLLLFQWQGQVLWWVGLLFAVGQGMSGFLAARFAIRIPWAPKLAYALLLLIVSTVLLRSWI